MPEKASSITKAPAVSDVHILWITAGLSCDGDSVSVTAAEQPSIEDVLLGAIPGLPRVHLHNPVLAFEVGDDFMKFLRGRAGAPVPAPPMAASMPWPATRPAFPQPCRLL